MTSAPIPHPFPNLYLFQHIFNYLPRNKQIKLLQNLTPYNNYPLIRDKNEESQNLLMFSKDLMWYDNLYPELEKNENYSFIGGNNLGISCIGIPDVSQSYTNVIGSGTVDIPETPNACRVTTNVAILNIQQSEYSRFEKSTIQGSNITIHIQPFAVVRYVIITGHDLEITFTSHKVHEHYNIQQSNTSLIF